MEDGKLIVLRIEEVQGQEEVDGSCCMMRRCVEYCMCVGSLAFGWRYGGMNTLLLQCAKGDSRLRSRECHALKRVQILLYTLHMSLSFCLCLFVFGYGRAFKLLLSTRRSHKPLQDCGR